MSGNYRPESLVIRERQRLNAEFKSRSEKKLSCPFVYAKGKRCTGHIIRVEAYKVDIDWTLRDDGTWIFGHGEPRSHYHVFCSEKGNHAKHGASDSDQMKFWFRDLPEGLREALK